MKKPITSVCFYCKRFQRKEIRETDRRIVEKEESYFFVVRRICKKCDNN